MADEQRQLMGQKQDDEHSDKDSQDGSDVRAEDTLHLFRSSLDVGSYFVEIEPDNELVFNNVQGTLYTQFNIKNVTETAHVAFFVSLTYHFNQILIIRFGLLLPIH